MSFVVLAQESGGGAWGSLVFLGLMIGVFYFLIIRPQRNRAKAQKELSASLEIGQEIRTIGGIHGKVLTVDEDSVLLAVEEGRIRVSRRAIGTRVGEDS
ncbi:MAG: preprotein translocase subunit YajC [Actinomycetota bacterium]|nr:preprotein translocase subunit YajC [Actinomycetota bacterium]